MNTAGLIPSQETHSPSALAAQYASRAGALSGNANSFGSNFIYYTAATRQIHVDGTWGDDRVVVDRINSNTVRVHFIGVQTSDFNIADVDSLVFRGFKGDDIFQNKTSISSSAFGYLGDDYLIGGSGPDHLDGGPGNDFLYGALNVDHLFGRDGRDQLLGGADDDVIYGGRGNDYLNGAAGNDFLVGASGNDELVGGAHRDRLWGGAGNDAISGHAGNDRIFGEANDDWISAGAGNDYVLAGDGNDYVKGGAGDDVLYGNAGHDVIRASGGRNKIDGGNGNDKLNGSRLDDKIIGGPGQDEIFGGSGNDVLLGGDHRDIILGQNGDDYIRGGQGNDDLDGGGGNDRLFGELGDDLIHGKGGNDYLYGGHGKDSLMGGQGSERDVLNGGAGYDKIIYFANDRLADRSPDDLRVQLKNASSRWNDREIDTVNQALAYLYQGTGNAKLAADALTGKDLVFEKVASLPGRATAINVLDSITQNGLTRYERVLRFADWNELNQARNDQQALIFVHEVSHNWDNDIELAAAPNVGINDWNRFVAVSNWRRTRPNNSYRRSADGRWWYWSGAQFARSYGNVNPFEDWATTWELYFDPQASTPPAGSNLARKLLVLQSFFDKLS